MITNQQTRVEFDQHLENAITAVANATARLHNLGPDTELSILLVDNSFIRKLNAFYRKQDKATDVLSFAMNELGEDEPADESGEPIFWATLLFRWKRRWNRVRNMVTAWPAKLGF